MRKMTIKAEVEIHVVADENVSVNDMVGDLMITHDMGELTSFDLESADFVNYEITDSK